MPRKVYDPKLRSAFMQAAIAARDADKSWREAYDAAKEEGYTGSLQGIVKMVRGGQPAQGRKRGRKPGARPVGRPAGTGSASSIEGLVNKIVKDRVRAVLDRAIAELERLRDQ